jgi:hypothetical protein
VDKNAFLIQLSESDRTQFGRVDFESQSDDQRVFSAIWELESQVNNGGFAQYFSSAEGHTANFAPSALRRIGATHCADIVARALRTVSSNALPEDQGSREQLVEGLGNAARAALQSLDEEFLAYPDNLTNLLFDYVRSNPQAFGAIGGA